MAGDFLIAIGGIFCLLSALLFALSIAGGSPNGTILVGGGVLGLLMVIAGYLKRISVALTSGTLPANSKASTAP